MKTYYRLMSRRAPYPEFFPDHHFCWPDENKIDDYGEARRRLDKVRRARPEFEWRIAATSTATVLLD